MPVSKRNPSVYAGSIKRDPRVDPRACDELRERTTTVDIHIAVTMVGKSVHYDLRMLNGSKLDALSMACRMSKPQWRKWAASKSVEVIHVSD